MESAFQLIPKHDHSAPWERARAQDPHNRCPGKDPIDTKCTCPDAMYATKVRLYTGQTVESRIYCGCCDLPLASPPP